MKEMTRIHSGTLDTGISKREKEHSLLARKIAAEGMVLLKNERMLPINKNMPIALLGSGSVKTIKGGTGSGDVNNRETISIYQGMKEAGAILVSENWLKEYGNTYNIAREKWREKVLEDARHVENPFDAYAANSFSLPEGRIVKEDDIRGAEAAIYVISRISGEGKDRRKESGDYYLSHRETEDLLYLNKKKIPTILILNTGGPVELTDILKEAEYIRAVLAISQPGQEGGHAVADVLLGKAAPGGRLTATWAKRYEDYPCGETFGYLNQNLEFDEYREGIYVGYRYFDSFGIKPLFPFGYGLSYTSFEMKFDALRIKENRIEVDAVVENTGNNYAGREVVQIYITLPQNGRAKEYHRLAGFAKTRLLNPGESQRVTVVIEQKQMACFSEETHEWVIEKGRYGLWLGKHSQCLFMAAALYVPENTVIEKTYSVCPRKEEFEELGASPVLKDREKIWLKEAEKQGIQEYIFNPGKEKHRECSNDCVQEQPVEDLISILYGNITQDASTLGSAGRRVPGSAGETTEALEKKYNIRSLIMADGPAGLRLRQNYEVDRRSDTVYGVGVLGSLENGYLESMTSHEDADLYYQYCTAFPVGTALAQSWDDKLLEKFGKAIAIEMKEFHVDLWLAPGMNIQRNPLCGRNFEYYSEDPLLTGVMAAAVTRGVQSQKGCGVTIKHFACNNQEDNRMNVDIRVSERALREIYLRGFEIAVKQSDPAAIMTSYNRINGIYSANSKDLCTVITRQEWGFNGVIMSDWNTTVPKDGSIPWKCTEAGNDIIMPGNENDDRDIRRAFEKGWLSEKSIRWCAGHILKLVRMIEQ